MSFIVTLLYGAAALFLAAFGFWELRMLIHFLRNRTAIRGTPDNENAPTSPSPSGDPPTVTIQIPLYNERTWSSWLRRSSSESSCCN